MNVRRELLGPASTALLRVLAGTALLLLLTAPITPQSSAGEPGGTTFLQLRIDHVTPDVVTTTSEPVVTVTGTVTNVGDRPVHDVMVRLEHSPAVTSSSGLRTTLAAEPTDYSAVGDFTTVSQDLARGQSVPFRLAYPVRSADHPALDIDKPGVYPLLVNVNGTPDYGSAARLDDARFLLPVLGVPATPAAPGGSGQQSIDAVVPPDTAHPVALTLLWPLADRPHLAAGVPGRTEPARLADDDLATSLANGGRLDTLLAAADFATNDQVDPGGLMRGAMCLAIDPDLLITVNAMSGGYVVSDDPAAGLNSPTHPGAGQQAATEWLHRLRELAQRVCVTPTVYAQADLRALQRVGDAVLSSTATTDAGPIVNQLLGIQSLRGATVVGDGPLTGPAVGLLSAQPEPTVAIAAAPITADDSDHPADTSPRRYSDKVTMAPFDPCVAAALAGAGRTPISPGYLDTSLHVPLVHDSPVARRQDALASVLWRGLQPDAQPRNQILMPPLAWDVTPDDAQSILTSVATAMHSGLAVARPMPAVIAEAKALPPPLTATLPDNATGNPKARYGDDVTGQISTTMERVWGLTAALTVNTQTGLTGDQYTAPLREDMLRALTQSVPPSVREDLAQQRITTTQNTMNDLFHAVTVVNPGGSYTLATERSPLPLALRNDLPLPIRVRLVIDAPPGMTVTDMGEIELPPGYLPLRVPIEVHFTQRVAVDVALRTVNGLTLGEPVRLSVHSNAYGKVLFFITLSAGAVLFLLAGRRLWHRFRGQPDRADLDRPHHTRPIHADDSHPPRPDPLDTAIAHAPEDS
ncbi:hypothetical protein [Mycolicibacterium aubagnense]|uniref:Secreted protein n=1 Tax=Mycolicibacterium aubagnense TaxID=319707 RepID=A0ABM7IFL0_9MYCO|nr:hypothetical protein [Mycolicibacterium aubagnense]WGI32850.1 hypothetical protein QDT91_00115 [Mycolicibacterium aubagnense]BBX85484.1 hypothetical protein MAUB_33570 [Mycolicibacterium aubagnense]